MGVGVAVYALLLSLIGYALSDPAAPDCRKFVFAPLCRGVAAKRSHMQQMPKSYIIDANNLKALLKSFNMDTTARKNDWTTDVIKDGEVAKNSRRQKIQQQLDIGAEFPLEYD